MKKSFLFSSLLLLFFILPFSVKAFELRTQDSVYIDKEQSIKGNLYAAGLNITIDGSIGGDLICGAQSVTVNGDVAGDVICGAQSIDINGRVGGSVRVAANTVKINGQVARNVQAAGTSINLSSNSEVGWDVLFASAINESRGKVGGDFNGAGAKTIITGEIGGNVDLILDSQDKNQDSLVISDSAVIKGDLKYRSEREANISAKSQIDGGIDYQYLEKKQLSKLKSYGAKGFITLLSTLLVALILVAWWPNKMNDLLDNMHKKTWPSIGLGLLVLVVSPVVVVLFFFTIIGIPLAFLLGAFYFALLYLSKIIFSLYLGRLIWVNVFKKKTSLKHAWTWSAIIGAVILTILMLIPVLGWILVFMGVLMALGSLLMHCKTKCKK
jgi:cytoskeletal protein CcmA (bactofilin family)